MRGQRDEIPSFKFYQIKSDNSTLFFKHFLMPYNGFDCSDLFEDKCFFMASD